MEPIVALVDQLDQVNLDTDLVGVDLMQFVALLRAARWEGWPMEISPGAFVGDVIGRDNLDDCRYFRSSDVRSSGMSGVAVERNLSDFLRNSGEVLREVANHDVLLRRRDGDDLMLVRADRDAATRDAVSLSVGFMGWFAREHAATFMDALPTVFPWVHFLPEEDRDLFAREFMETLNACTSLQSFEQLGILLQQWRNTADAWSQPGLARVLRRDQAAGGFDEPVASPSP